MTTTTHRPEGGHRRPVRLGDPWVAGVALAGTLVVGGLVAIALAWWGCVRTEVPATEVAYVVSGGAGGAALVVTGSVLGRIQLVRYDRAVEGARVTALVERAVGTIEW